MNRGGNKWTRHLRDAHEHTQARQENIAEVMGGIRSMDSRNPLDHRGLLDNANQQGRSVELPAAPLNDPVSVLSLNSDDQKARVVTVHLVSTPIQTGTPLEEIRADVSWGVGGVQAIATIDWLSGTAFTVAASFLRVSGRRITAQSVDDIRVGAFAAYGSISGSMRAKSPQLTGAPAIVAFGNVSANWAVPEHAQNLVMLRTNDGISTIAASMTLEFRDVDGVTLLYSANYGAGQSMDIPIDLANRVRAVRVWNNDPAGGATFRPVWGLAI